MPRYLDPKSDLVFRKIFGNHPDLLKSFLNSVLPLPEDGLIASLTYLPSEHVPELPGFKNPIVDVRCTDARGRIFIVEMQIQWSSAFMKRVLFNTSSAYVRQLKKGRVYKALRPVYGLAILAHNLISKKNKEWFHHFKMTHTKDNQHSLDDIHLVLVELKKFKPETIREKKLTVLWLRFLSEISEETYDIPLELLEEPEIKEAIDLTKESAYTPEELESYYKYWDAVSTQKTLMQDTLAEGEAKGKAEGLAEGEAKGKAEGLAEGEAKGKAEFAYQLAKKQLQRGVAIEHIMDDTGLTRDEIIRINSSQDIEK